MTTSSFVAKMESMTNLEQNVKQKAFWSGKGGDVWVERQRELDITLKPLGDAALKKIDLSNCSKILDIGCGTGRTTLDIASEHANSTVSGLDISLPMLVQAKTLAANENNKICNSILVFEKFSVNGIPVTIKMFKFAFYETINKDFL